MPCTISCLHIQQLKSNIIIHLEPCFWPPAEYKSNIPPSTSSAPPSLSPSSLPGTLLPLPGTKGRLQHIISSVEKVIGCNLSFLQDLYAFKTHRRAGMIVADPSHPRHKALSWYILILLALELLSLHSWGSSYLCLNAVCCVQWLFWCFFNENSCMLWPKKTLWNRWVGTNTVNLQEDMWTMSWNSL